MELNTIQDYLRYTKVIDIFYLKDKTTLKHRLHDYLLYGTKSLARKYMTQKKIPLCEYRLVKVLTFFDVIRDNAKQSQVFSEFLCIVWHTLIDYLLEYTITECTLECVKYTRFDFFTHYAKRYLTQYTLAKTCDEHVYKIRVNQVDKFQEKEHIHSMTLLDVNQVYKVVKLKKSQVEFISGTAIYYVITLFSCTNTLTIGDYWLPKSCLVNIQGSKYIHPNGNMEIYQNQYISIVHKSQDDDNVKIQSHTIKSITQLKKGQQQQHYLNK